MTMDLTEATDRRIFFELTGYKLNPLGNIDEVEEKLEPNGISSIPRHPAALGKTSIFTSYFYILVQCK